MGRRNAPAVRMAVCGVTAALASAIMLVGTWIPAATFCCPVLASLLLIPVEREYGVRLSLCWYGAVAALSLVLAAVWLLACVTFGLYDLLLGRLTVLYLRRLRFGK